MIGVAGGLREWLENICDDCLTAMPASGRIWLLRSRLWQPMHRFDGAQGYLSLASFSSKVTMSRLLWVFAHW
jgi:hypothetical protein